MTCSAVTTTTWDAVISALPAPPNVVKIDCEGGEYPGLLTCRRLGQIRSESRNNSYDRNGNRSNDRLLHVVLKFPRHPMAVSYLLCRAWLDVNALPP